MSDPKRTVAGMYIADPQVMLHNTISFALGVAAGVVQQDASALQRLCTDNALADRAARYLLNQLLQQMIEQRELHASMYKTMVDDLIKMSRED